MCAGGIGWPECQLSTALCEDFRRKLAEARERMTPEKWAELRRTFGRDAAA
jgi:hypothetical protein